jgi:lipoic acid synthetase
VAYPIIKLSQKDLHHYLQSLLEVVAAVVRKYGLEPVFRKGQPGVWVDGGKIASIGIAVKKWVTYHGVALNVNIDLNAFNWIVPCGHRDETMTSMQALLGKSIDPAEVKNTFIQKFRRSFAYGAQANTIGKATRHPDWLRRPAPGTTAIDQMEGLLAQQHLSTVCQNAQCPNLGECFQRGTATFMILGTCCTRACRFCAVDKGRPRTVDPLEPERIARVVQSLGLTYVVITSVTRDDLTDGGAEQFVQVIAHLRERCKEAGIEILIPDFKGSLTALQKICEAQPDMLNHNIETVSRLYPRVRPGAQYRRSLAILEYAARQGLPVKSGLIMGLGETENEVMETLIDLKRSGCRYLTLGQYLPPSPDHFPVAHYLPPEEFDRWAETARQLGFSGVAAGPLVRSSYHADEMFTKSNVEGKIGNG